MNNICYVITVGEYSDYRIKGVFSTREGAERILALVHQCYEEARIEEMIFDILPKEVIQYQVKMVVESGEVCNIETVDVVNSYPYHNGYIFQQAPVLVRLPGYVFTPPWIVAHSVTEKRAIKVCSEWRTRFLGSGLTVDDWNETLT